MGCSVSKKTLGKFIICVAFAAFFELRDAPKVPGGIMQLSKLIDLIAILVMLFFVFLLLELEVVCVITRIRSQRMGFGVYFQNRNHGVIQKGTVVGHDQG